MDERDVGLTQSRHVLGCQRLDSVLDRSRRQVVCVTTSGVICQSSIDGGCIASSTRVVETIRVGVDATVTVAVNLRRCGEQRVASLTIEVQSHVATQQTRGGCHDVIEGGVEQQLGNGDGETVLRDRDAELRRRKCVGAHANALCQLRSSREVVVTHEVNLKTRGNAQLGLLYCELLEAKNRHCLEQDFLGPNLLNRLSQVGVGTRIRGRRRRQGTTTSNGVCHVNTFLGGLSTGWRLVHLAEQPTVPCRCCLTEQLGTVLDVLVERHA